MKTTVLFSFPIQRRIGHAFLLICCLGSGHSFGQAPARNYFYRLTTLWQGDNLALDIQNDGTNDIPVLKPAAGFASQLWKIAPLDATYNRITNLNFGDEMSVDIDNDGVNNNRPVLRPSEDYSGQAWKITAIDSEYSRLTTEWQGDGLSLDILADGVNNNQTILNPTADYSGQFWKLQRAVLMNDEPCGALLLPVDGVVQASFGNWYATVAAGEQGIAPNGQSCLYAWCDTTIENSVWFKFLAPSTGAVEISTCGVAEFDTQMAVYFVGECSDFSSFQLLEANDDGQGCADYSSFLTVDSLLPDQTYYLLIDGYGASTGRFSLKLTTVEASPVQEIVANEIVMTVAPNPASETISIQLHTGEGMLGFTLNDLTGKTIQAVQFDNPVRDKILNISHLQKGVYVLRLAADGKLYTRKVIIQ